MHIPSERCPGRRVADLPRAGRTAMAAAFALCMTVAAAAHGADSAYVPGSRPGEAFFTREVLPKLVENGCQMCHAVGYVQPNVMLYVDLLPYLAMGEEAEANPVIRKLANLRAIRPDLPTHPGGPRCETVQSEPCASILRWREVEFGTGSGDGGAQP